MPRNQEEPAGFPQSCSAGRDRRWQHHFSLLFHSREVKDFVTKSALQLLRFQCDVLTGSCVWQGCVAFCTGDHSGRHTVIGSGLDPSLLLTGCRSNVTGHFTSPPLELGTVKNCPATCFLPNMAESDSCYCGCQILRLQAESWLSVDLTTLAALQSFTVRDRVRNLIDNHCSVYSKPLFVASAF